MEYSIIIILMALLQYIVFTMQVGASRGKYNITAPHTQGNEKWERLFRVQQNTMEQLIIFIPALIIFTHYVSSKWALLPGIIFIIGRQLFAFAYAKKPASRGTGMILSFFSNIALVVGSLIAIGIKILG